MKIHVRRISPGSLSLTLAAIYGTIGLAVGVSATLGLLLRFGVGYRANSPFSSGILDGISTLVIYPATSALVGAISGLVMAWLYNFYARFTKGVLLEYDEARRQDD